MLSVAFAVFAGILAGLLGVFPFLHTNSLLQFFAKNFSFESLALGAFAVALSFSHLVFETIPLVFFALPSQNQSIGVLPAHRLVLEGKGFLAARIVLRTLFYAFFFSLALLPLALAFTPPAFQAIRPLTGFVLLAIVFIALFKEPLKNAFLGASVFLLAGLIGFATLAFPIAREPLFPLLSGLFAVPSLLYSFGRHENKNLFKESENGRREARARVDKKLVLLGVFGGAFSVLLPALNPALLCAVLFLLFEGLKTRRTRGGGGESVDFLVASTAVVVSKMLFDFAAVYSIGKARSGAAVVVKSVGVPLLQDFLVIIAAGAVAFVAAFAIAVIAYKKISSALDFFDYNHLIAGVLLLLVAGCFLVSGFGGLLVLGTAAALGCVTPLAHLKRSYAMGALIFPSLIYFFGLETMLISLIR